MDFSRTFLFKLMKCQAHEVSDTLRGIRRTECEVGFSNYLVVYHSIGSQLIKVSNFLADSSF